MSLQLDEDRAHLEPDAARLEQREPRPGERLALAEAELAVAELEQEIEMRVGDHVAESRASLASAHVVSWSICAGRAPDLDIPGTAV